MNMADPNPARSTDTSPSVQQPRPHASVKATAGRRSPHVPLYKIYAQPVPLKTFPLPTFYPNNPLSILHLAYAWLSNAIFSPPSEPATVHRGIWSPATRSVHVTEPDSMRALWEQGFFGKGNLSRSEPNWLKREQIRRGLVEASVSELHTLKRREERSQAKWERGRTELNALEQQRLAEGRFTEAMPRTEAYLLPGTSFTEHIPDSPNVLAPPPGYMPSALYPAAPVGPLELLALPNSSSARDDAIRGQRSVEPASSNLAPGILGMNDLSGQDPGSENPSILPIPLQDITTGMARPAQTRKDATGNNNSNAFATAVNGDSEPRRLKHQKSVRFSPKVESTTFQLSDPPSPNHYTQTSPRTLGELQESENLGSCQAMLADQVASTAWRDTDRDVLSIPPAEVSAVEPIFNKEHLQLSAEEAFFLVFALGALSVISPLTQTPLAVGDLFQLFRQHSCYPPSLYLDPDDPFIVHYAVYHHFRSLGWVPRHGIKFGVDWMLYDRGPVFNHAEFGLLVIPSYSHPYWADKQRRGMNTSWRWLHGVNRVLSTVFKSLVLVYVDIPPPTLSADGGHDDQDIVHLLGQYRIREVMVKRWSSNRNRN